MAVAASTAGHRRDATDQPWINTRSWDLWFLIGSAGLVFAVYWLWSLGVPRLYVNMAVTLAVGGPHMFSTYVRTAMEPQFIRRYPLAFFGGIVLIPTMVISLGLLSLPLLLTVFFTAASFHVAHQFAYVSVTYALNAGERPSRRSQALDFGVVFMSMHMPALYLLTRSEFALGEEKLLFPEFLRQEWVWLVALSLWLLSVTAFALRSVTQYLRGEANFPRMLLLVVAILVALYVPTRSNLDVSFQGINAWHSLQYLALTWYISRRWHDSQGVSLDFVARITRPGGFPLFYGFCFALTVGSAAVILTLSSIIGFPYEQAYYLVVLSFLLIHYAFDHILFTDFKAIAR